jgi:hypothetical protein
MGQNTSVPFLKFSCMKLLAFWMERHGSAGVGIPEGMSRLPGGADPPEGRNRFAAWLFGCLSLPVNDDDTTASPYVSRKQQPTKSLTLHAR